MLVRLITLATLLGTAANAESAPHPSPPRGLTPTSVWVEGLDSVPETRDVQFHAFAAFNDGSTWDVTLMCDWAVEPHHAGTVSSGGLLTTSEVDEDVAASLIASLTWDDFLFGDAHPITIWNIPSDPETGHQWPCEGGGPRRLGRTSAVGPVNPVEKWRLAVNQGFPEDYGWLDPLVIDGHNRGFCNGVGPVAIDLTTGSQLWSAEDMITESPGVLHEDTIITILNAEPPQIKARVAATGKVRWDQEWSEFGEPSYPVGDPVIGQDGMLYSGVAVQLPEVEYYLLKVDPSNGSLVWKVAGCGTRPFAAVGWPVLVLSSKDQGWAAIAGYDPVDGQLLWTVQTERELMAPGAIYNGRVYQTSNDNHFYVIDELTGDLLVRHDLEQYTISTPTVGWGGTVYVTTTGNIGYLYAFTADGELLWRVNLPGLSYAAPIVDATGTIYVVSTFHCDYGQNNKICGWVEAYNPDGSLMWQREYYDQGWFGNSPTIGADGTLYVISGHSELLALGDPCATDLNADFSVDVGDLLLVIGQWGTAGGDVTGDGETGVDDVLAVINSWGAC